MLHRAAWVGKAIILACMVAAPLLIHAAIVTDRWTSLIVVLPLVQLLIVGVAAFLRRSIWMMSLSVAAAASGLVFIWMHTAGTNVKIFPALPHAFAYLTLLFGFAWSLLAGQEAVLTRIATRIRGPLQPELRLYSRRVTFVWCIFFAAQLVGSFTLFIWAPAEVWSFFVNVLNLPLVLLMFGAEYLYRLIRFPEYRHDSFSDMMRVFTKAREGGPRQVDSV